MPISGASKPLSAANGISNFSRASISQPTPPQISKYDPAPNYDPLRRPTVSTPISAGPKLQAVNPVKPYSYSEPNIAPYTRLPVKQPAGFSLAPGSPSLTLPPSANPTSAPSIGASPKVNLPEIANSAKNLGSALPAGALAGLARGLVGAILAKGLNDDLKYQTSPAGRAEQLKRFQDGVNQAEAIKKGIGEALKNLGIPSWLNPLHQQRDPLNPQKPDQTITFQSGVRLHFYSPNNGIYTDQDVISYSIIPSPPPSEYPYYLSLTRPDGIHIAFGPNIDPSTLQIQPIPGQPLPPLPNSPLQVSRPPDVTGIQPDYVPANSIKPFTPNLEPLKPASLPNQDGSPEKYPTLDPKKSDLPLPKTNRPVEPNKIPAPFIPTIPFIPLPAKAPQSLNQNSGFQSLANPSTSPLVNPGTGAGGNLTPPPPPIAPARPRCRDGCAARLEDKIDGLGEKVKTGVPFINPNGQPVDLGLLQVINEKLGTQLLGGISGKLNRIAITLQFDRIMQALNLITVLHNASMLSGSLASTLGSVTSQALSVIGIKDENGSPLDINGILSKEADDLMKSVLGNEIWSGTKENWNKANRIISTASQIVWTIRSMADATRDVMEWTAENTGKIGNALKRFRVVGEHAYSWMPERVNVQNRWTQKVNQFTENVSNIDNTASSLASVVGSVQSIEDEFGQIKEQRENFEKALKEATPKAREDNDATKQKATATTAASASPVLQTADRDKGEATP